VSTEGDLRSRVGAENARKLVSWKAIAEYFGCDVRTVRRWEMERNLPVYRAPGGKRSTVFAYASDLDAWLESGPHHAQPGSLPDAPNGEADKAVHAWAFAASTVKAHPTGAASLLGSSLARLRRFLQRPIWVFLGTAVLVASAWVLVEGSERRHPAKAESARALSLIALHMPAHDAEELYLRGRYFWNLRTADSLSKAIDAYTQAIKEDPSYADAYAGLAECYDLLPQFAHADLSQSLKQAEYAADRAIALNPNLAAAHRAKAFALFYWDWDIAGSDAEFKRALALDPGSAQTHQWYSGTLQCRSDGAEAIGQIDEAVRLDPTSPAIAADAALLHADFGDFKSSVKTLREIEQTQPTLASPAEFLRELDFAIGNFPAYVDDTRQFAAITHAPDDAALAKAVAQGWARAGRTGLLEARAAALKAKFNQGNESGFKLGETLLLLGHRQEALFYFRAALDRHAVQFVTIDDYPWSKQLSDDPGYAALFAQIRQRVREVIPDQPKQSQVQARLPE